MPDLIRTFAVRNPVPISPRELAGVGIRTHPSKYQSTEYKKWLPMCENGTREVLEHEFTAFLQGKAAVRSIDDLGPEWAEVIRAFELHGATLDASKVLAILGRTTSASLFGRRQRKLYSVRTRVADTMLALSFLRRLGHRANPDYQFMLRTITVVERALDPEMRAPVDSEIRRHFERPILLPSCFFPFDSCRKRVAGGAALPSEPTESRPAKGCVAARDCTCRPNEECPASTTFPGPRQLYFPTGDNYPVGKAAVTA